MSPSTETLFDEMIRHAKGMISSLEKWLAKEKQESRPRIPPPSEREQNDRLPS